ncbi:hypothetical protein [Streptomyces clavuligerus]|uniref:hypothetical protein n=1 Tax=Streptomyces clavuligerus TaxID=1901 RepID=UPI00017FF8AB|nr:hypothetical protein [Streptomyces clavuligerus]ANW22626.1 hypothetical protein BB341_30445 [Streptomyces clavuligerus]AXU16905.1 hypothetical protein D1794_29540 [Streptomyces clavuligerus]AXU17486.1 hypothetical protein D1794_33615 [Streptomyces clavuligerus]EDY48680.1 hypothetical protein SSCG_01708 [Streptomyces clavuligerus]MBY6301017.1 hypothetical protein [Streptomyces clavuligerus]
MRLVWLAVLGVITVVMAVLTPVVFRTESSWGIAAWSVLIVGTAVFTAALIRAEVLLRSAERRAGSGTSDT